MNTSENFPFGELLQQLRKRKRLNQKQLAVRIGVSRETISLWERGEYKPETDKFLYELVRVLGLTEQEQQQLFEAYTVTALATSFHNPPLKRNPYFTGRSSQLNKLHTLLMAGKQVALTQAITGLGGIGKTQLALEYAYRHQKSYHDIFWVNADTKESLMASYVLLAGLLHLPEYEESDQNKVRKAVQHWFRKHTGWLLILDNMEDLNLLQQFVSIDRHGAVLLTTRRQVTEPVAQALELELLPENDAILFLLKRTKVLTVDKSLEDASDNDIEAARAITQLLDNLPLALDQAGAYILETSCGFAEYLALFQTYPNRLLQRRIGEGIPADHPESVAATFSLNFQQVRQRNEIATELLQMCAFLAPDDIGEEILVQEASKSGARAQSLSTDGLLLNQAIEVLRIFSLVQRNPKERTLRIHRLVQDVLRHSMAEQECEMWVEQTVYAVNTAMKNTETNPSSRPATLREWSRYRERYLPHLQVCAKWIDDLHIVSREAAELLDRFAHDLSSSLESYNINEIIDTLYKAIGMWEKVLGPDDLHIVACLRALYPHYRWLGKQKEATELLRQASAIEQCTDPKVLNAFPSRKEIMSALNSPDQFAS